VMRRGAGGATGKVRRCAQRRSRHNPPTGSIEESLRFRSTHLITLFGVTGTYGAVSGQPTPRLLDRIAPWAIKSPQLDDARTEAEIAAADPPAPRSGTERPLPRGQARAGGRHRVIASTPDHALAVSSGQHCGRTPGTAAHMVPSGDLRGRQQCLRSGRKAVARAGDTD